MSISILNDVLGPVMRGPSSSHTAGAYHIAKIVRDLFIGQLKRIKFVFDPNGSYSQTYREQFADKAFCAGLLGRKLTDENFMQSIEDAATEDVKVEFEIKRFAEADHPNSVLIEVQDASIKKYELVVKSVGGGSVIVSSIDGWRVDIEGSGYGTLIFLDRGLPADEVEKSYSELRDYPGDLKRIDYEGSTLFINRSVSPFDPEDLKKLESIGGIQSIRQWNPLQFVKSGPVLFPAIPELIVYIDKNGESLGSFGIAAESALLNLSKDDCCSEMASRLKVMRESVEFGMNDDNSTMELLDPSARRVADAVNSDRTALGGPHALAGARAMAVMHGGNSGGIVCAAPTGGSAGVIPAVMMTLTETLNIDKETAVRSLYAAGMIGRAVAMQATFAAEEAGCQVEIGAAGAMAAAAVVEAVNGTAEQALDAAAIALQNTMGSVCDLVQGRCELPCHTRNAAAASNAFLCADLILGGYENPIPLHETIDAMYAVGKMLPSELRCTSKGGLAMAPSALGIKYKR